MVGEWRNPVHLTNRPRRLRSTPAIRTLVRETTLQADDFILPLFVSEKVTGKTPVASMPGVFQLSEKELITEAAAAHGKGVSSVLLFGIPAHKDEQASQAYAADGVVQRAVRALKKEIPELVVIYLNRLSDLLFTLAWLANKLGAGGEITW